MRAQEFINEISDERLQDYLSRAGSKVDRRMTRMAQARDRLNKGYEIYHADAPNKVVDRFEASTPAEAQRYYNNFISKYESDVDYDLRLRRATGIMESVDFAQMQSQQIVAVAQDAFSHLYPGVKLYSKSVVEGVGLTTAKGQQGAASAFAGSDTVRGAFYLTVNAYAEGDSMIVVVEDATAGQYKGASTAIIKSLFEAGERLYQTEQRELVINDNANYEAWSTIADRVGAVLSESADYIRNAIKESVEAYHGTFQPTLDKFNSLSHFGTLKAAQDRIKAKARREKIKTPGRIYQVTLDIKNPFIAKDFAGVHSPTHFAFDLKNQGLISQEEMLAITELAGEPGQVPVLIKKLRELGFDGIAYKNKYEDKGSTSYVILDPSQVVSVKPVTANTLVSEAFDQPYRLIWEKGEYGSYDAYTQLPDGTNLSINFNLESAGPYGEDEEWQVEFWRNYSLAVTGGGDAQRIFATVLAAIADFVEQEDHPERISFSASKDVEPGQNAQSRAKLYDRMVQRYAAALGYSVTRQDRSDAVNYELSRKAPVHENFADGKNPGRKGLAKRSGVDCKQSVTKLRDIAKHSTGERQRMAHWCANMKAGKK